MQRNTKLLHCIKATENYKRQKLLSPAKRNFSRKIGIEKGHFEVKNLEK